MGFDSSVWKIEDGNKLIQEFTGNWFGYDTISEQYNKTEEK